MSEYSRGDTEDFIFWAYTEKDIFGSRVTPTMGSVSVIGRLNPERLTVRFSGRDLLEAIMHIDLDVFSRKPFNSYYF